MGQPSPAISVIVKKNKLQYDVSEIVKLPLIDFHDVDDIKTIGDYLITLLREVWIREESFSGKRPFGNSGWQYDLYKPLVLGKYVKGEYEEWSDENGNEWIDVVEYDYKHADKIILDCINSICFNEDDKNES